MKRAIVTGANGFIGTWLIKELIKNNVEVIAVVRNENSNIEAIPKKAKIVYLDMASISELKNITIIKDIDVFYHLAWEGTGGKERSNYNLQLLNIKYACDSFVVAKDLNCKRFIGVGTITEKIAEDILNSKIKNENAIYGIAKLTTHCMLKTLSEKLGLPFIWARLANIYGENDTSENIVNYTINELSKGKRPSFSTAEQPYDLMYVADAGNALYLLGEKNAKENCYFVGRGEVRALKEYLIKIKDIYGNNAQINLGERPADNLEYHTEWFDTGPLKRDTGFQASYTFEEGINNTLNAKRQK